MSVTTRKSIDHILYSTTVASTAGFVSSSMNRNFMSGYSVLIKTTMNTTTGSIVYNLQGSIEDTTTSYVDIADSTITVSETGSTMYNVSSPFYNFVRVNCTATSTPNFNVSIISRSVEL